MGEAARNAAHGERRHGHAAMARNTPPCCASASRAWTIRPNLTAEENGVAILKTQTQLLALQRAQEALQASLADGVSHQGDVGLLRTQLLAGMVEGLIALQQADDDSAMEPPFRRR